MANQLLPYHTSPATLEAGCDEAGRGCLCGPVTAAAVILPPGFGHGLLNDSKKMTGASRRRLRAHIIQNAVAWAVGWVHPPEIDRINILNASILAMHRALKALDTAPAFVLVDGNRFKPFGGLPHLCVVKGDAKYASMAAASVLAKTFRDDYMQQLHQQYPQYAWDSNKGYPTKAHRAAIAQHAATPHHRRSFRLLPQGEQQRLFGK